MHVLCAVQFSLDQVHVGVNLYRKSSNIGAAKNNSNTKSCHELELKNSRLGQRALKLGRCL